MRKHFLFQLSLILILLTALVLAQEPMTPKVEKRVEIVKKEGKEPCFQPGCQQHARIRKEVGPKKRIFIEELKLTEEQKANWEKIRDKYLRERIKISAELKLAQLDLKEALKTLDQKKIDAAVKNINELRGRLFQNRINEHVEFLKLLNEEQRKKLEELKTRRGPLFFFKWQGWNEFPKDIDWGEIREKIEEVLPKYGFLDFQEFSFDIPFLENIEEEDVEIGPELPE